MSVRLSWTGSEVGDGYLVGDYELAAENDESGGVSFGFDVQGASPKFCYACV